MTYLSALHHRLVLSKLVFTVTVPVGDCGFHTQNLFFFVPNCHTPVGHGPFKPFLLASLFDLKTPACEAIAARSSLSTATISSVPSKGPKMQSMSLNDMFRFGLTTKCFMVCAPSYPYNVSRFALLSRNKLSETCQRISQPASNPKANDFQSSAHQSNTPATISIKTFIVGSLNRWQAHMPQQRSAF